VPSPAKVCSIAVVHQTGMMLRNCGLGCCNDISCVVNQLSYTYSILCTVSQSEFYQYLSPLKIVVILVAHACCQLCYYKAHHP